MPQERLSQLFSQSISKLFFLFSLKTLIYTSRWPWPAWFLNSSLAPQHDHFSFSPSLIFFFFDPSPVGGQFLFSIRQGSICLHTTVHPSGLLDLPPYASLFTTVPALGWHSQMLSPSVVTRVPFHWQKTYPYS